MRKGIKKQFWLSEKDAADLKQKAQRREMYAIGNSLNQLARKAHSLGFIDAPKLREVLTAYQHFQASIEAEFLRPVKKEIKK